MANVGEVQSAGPRLHLSPSARAILTQLLLHGAVSRAELARHLSVSSANVTKVCRPLIKAGYLRPSEVEANGARTERGVVGKPSQPLEVVPEIASFLGIKLTHNMIYATVVSLGAELLDAVDAEMADTDAESVADQIAHITQGMRSRRPNIAGIGISLPGPIRPDSPMIPDTPALGWSDVPFASMITQRTGLVTTLQNDGRALAAAEHWFGAGKGLSDFVLLTIGVGTGCSITAGGVLQEGKRGLAGQVDHLPIAANGPECSRGHRGCLSSFVSTACLSEATRPGAGLLWEECRDLALSGDQQAVAAFRAAGHALGVVAAHITNMVDPELIIISGAIAELADITSAEVSEAFRGEVERTDDLPKIVTRTHDFVSWSQGAAVVAIQRYIDMLGDS